MIISRQKYITSLMLIITTVMICSCARKSVSTRSIHFKQKGHASWYGPGFAGRKTANGERFNPRKLTAAHKKLPFNTLVRVTHSENGKSVVVRINDRGPFIRGRIIDLSKEAARQIGMLGTGTAHVKVVAVSAAEVGEAKRKRSRSKGKSQKRFKRIKIADEIEEEQGAKKDKMPETLQETYF